MICLIGFGLMLKRKTRELDRHRRGVRAACCGRDCVYLRRPNRRFRFGSPSHQARPAPGTPRRDLRESARSAFRISRGEILGERLRRNQAIARNRSSSRAGGHGPADGRHSHSSHAPSRRKGTPRVTLTSKAETQRAQRKTGGHGELNFAISDSEARVFSLCDLKPFSASSVFHLLARYVAIACVLAVIAASAASAGTVSGTVRNGTTGKVAAGIDVILIQLQGGMQPVANGKTDSQGRYHFDNPGLGQAPMLIRDRKS